MTLADYVEGVAEGRRGTLVQRQKDRSVWRVEEGGRVWFAKRGVTPKRRREIRREAENAQFLQARGAGPSVLARGMRKDGEWIVTASAGPGDLATTLGLTSVFPEAAQMRPMVMKHVADAIRRLHDDGICLPDLCVEHIFSSHAATLFIDPARLIRCAGRASVARRARDLAALTLSLRLRADWDPALRTNTVRLIASASGLRGDALRDLCWRVDAELTKVATRTRWRHCAWRGTDDFLHALHAVLDVDDMAFCFVELFASHQMTVVRTLPDRENRTLGRGPDGKPLFFVKVFPPTKSGWSPAMREIAAIELFQRAGILVNRVAAYAEDVDKGSMIAVKAAAGEPLDDLLRRGVTVAERRALAVQTARIWRRMRECGLRHRDAYPCHLFAAPWSSVEPSKPIRSVGATHASPSSADANPLADQGDACVAPTKTTTGPQPRHELRLIDLTRAGRAPFPKERWFVKDAAALWHGLPKPPVTRTDAVRWLREYFRIDRLDARAKRFARRVAAKERRIATRQARKARR